MLNWIFLILIAAGVLTGAYTDHMKEVTDASFASARTAVDLAIGLIGQMALWLGFMRILQEAGLMRTIARVLRPVMTWLFPEVPPDHPAIGAIVMNLAANAAGVGNAATPFGLMAMRELNKLNKHKGVATNAMATFLAINTAGVAVLPLTAIAVRASAGSKNPAGIILPSILATSITTVVGVIAAKLFQRMALFSAERALAGESYASAVEEPSAPTDDKRLDQANEEAAKGAPITAARGAITFVIVVAMLGAVMLHLSGHRLGPGFSVLPIDGTRSSLAFGIVSDWILPIVMLTIVFFGFSHRVKIYEVFVTGAKEGFQIAITIIPYLVAMLAAISIFRASGALDALQKIISPVTSFIGIPVEVLPMALLKPLSGSGSLAIMADTMKTYGPDSLVGYMVSVMNGSTETTFYVLAVYFGSVQVRAVRHTLAACLVADAIGLASAVYLTRLFFG